MSAVIDAWASLTSWVNDTLPGLAVEQALPNTSDTLGDIGACAVLNSHPPSRTQFWESSGPAVATLSGLKITTMSGVSIQPATAIADSNSYKLPFNFGTMVVSGSYSYTEPCTLVSPLGRQTGSVPVTGSGTITFTINDGAMSYTATLGQSLSISGASCTGPVTVTVDPDTGGLPAWIANILNFFSSFDQAQALTDSVSSVFANASFTTTMITLLNDNLSGGS